MAGKPKTKGAIEVWAGTKRLGELVDGKLTVKFSEPGFYPVFLKALNDEGAVFVMLGNAGGKLKAGRYVDYPGYGMLGHRTTANLYTTFLNIAGNNAERFGMADPNLKDLDQTGPLTELLA